MRATPTPAAALVLPGMSLNETIFPDLGVPVIAADFNGFDGRRYGGTTMHAYVDAVERLTHNPLWETARRRIVVGHSFGGMLALAWLAGRGVAGIHGLVLIATTAGPMYDVVRVRLAGPLRIPVSGLMRLWDSRLVTAGMKRLFGSETAGDIDFQTYAGRSDLAIGLAGWRLTAPGARHSYRAAMRGFDLRDHLGGLAVPTIVLHGTRDVYFPPGVARRLAAELPEVDLRFVAGAGHLLPLSHPSAVRRAVEQLIAD